MDVEIIETKDGSHTLFSRQFDEIYHSRNGALAESQHIFIGAGLGFFDRPELRVFEVGFGTGLNALLTWIYAESKAIHIDYDTMELYPVPQDLISGINYPDLLGSRDKFYQLHEFKWGDMVDLSPHFSFVKFHASILGMKYPHSCIDVIFFDAFSPEKQPEMWTADVFASMYDILRPGGILVTYCAKSYVRKNMQQVGFEITKLPGPPGKRDMVRATKK
jgi:tRNA U34 5-methylaminomethyl-2-thiouridine-forming methyltransferase MnmC